jgi:DNA-directed RNA polymerase specialized sigma24 family protein
MNESFTSDDLRRVAKRAWKRGHREAMQQADVEDVIGDVLVDAVRTASTTGGSTVALAHTNVKRGRYTTRVVVQAERNDANHALGVGNPTLEASPDDYDYAYIVSHAAEFLPADIEAATDLWDLVYRLSIEQAQAFTLHAYFEFTLADTAFMLGTSVSTVDRNVKRARASLQHSLLNL